MYLGVSKVTRREIPEISTEANLQIIHIEAQPMIGSIKRLTDKGFGFIGVEGEEKDLFFHSSALVGVAFDELREGDAVSFETEDSDKGPRATNVQLASDDQSADADEDVA